MALSTLFKFRGAAVYRRVLAFVILLLAGLLVLVFVRYRMQNGAGVKQEPSAESSATLSINGFRHTATRNGRTSWILEAKTARLYANENRAALSDVHMRYFTKDQQEIRLTAEKGQFNTRTQNMSVSGSVVCRYRGYVLKTENLHYQDDSRIIYTESGIVVEGQGTQFTGDSAEFKINTGILKLNGHVNARINQNNAD